MGSKAIQGSSGVNQRAIARNAYGHQMWPMSLYSLRAEKINNLARNIIAYFVIAFIMSISALVLIERFKIQDSRDFISMSYI